MCERVRSSRRKRKVTFNKIDSYRLELVVIGIPHPRKKDSSYLPGWERGRDKGNLMESLNALFFRLCVLTSSMYFPSSKKTEAAWLESPPTRCRRMNNLHLWVVHLSPFSGCSPPQHTHPTRLVLHMTVRGWRLGWRVCCTARWMFLSWHGDCCKFTFERVCGRLCTSSVAIQKNRMDKIVTRYLFSFADLPTPTL